LKKYQSRLLLEQTLESCLARRKHSQRLNLPSMWIRSYFAATAGNVSATIIEKYIAAQKGR
jgi:REP element-mobilizing transposase RayT